MNRSVIAIACFAASFPAVTLGQESSVPTTEMADPAVPSAKIKESLEMIRRVEELDKLVAEVERLRTENARLKEELKKETTSLPLIVVKSKAISATDAVAMLEIAGTKLRVRQNSAILISINKGDATPLVVKQITPDSIEVELPDLQRTLVLHE